jgi:hypothetical protein
MRLADLDLSRSSLDSMQVGELMRLVASAFDCSPSSLQLIHKGTTLNIGDAKEALTLKDGGEPCCSECY